MTQSWCCQRYHFVEGLPLGAHADGSRSIFWFCPCTQVRAAIEEQCNLIAQGKASKDGVVAHALAVFEAKFRFGWQDRRRAMTERCFVDNGITCARRCFCAFPSLALARASYFVANVNKMDELFEAVFSPVAATGKPFTRCGRCRKYMTFMPMRPQRLLCTTCNETYALPQEGTVKVYGEVSGCVIISQGHLSPIWSAGGSGAAIRRVVSLPTH